MGLAQAKAGKWTWDGTLTKKVSLFLRLNCILIASIFSSLSFAHILRGIPLVVLAALVLYVVVRIIPQRALNSLAVQCVLYLVVIIVSGFEFHKTNGFYGRQRAAFESIAGFSPGDQYEIINFSDEEISIDYSFEILIRATPEKNLNLLKLLCERQDVLNSSTNCSDMLDGVIAGNQVTIKANDREYYIVNMSRSKNEIIIRYIST